MLGVEGLSGREGVGGIDMDVGWMDGLLDG
jgi:hypothetical protein